MLFDNRYDSYSDDSNYDSHGNICDVCRGTGKNTLFNEICSYCNGIGEWNSLAQSYMINHICQCITLDRKFCPICEKKCHHDSSQTPKCIDGSNDDSNDHGGQGMSMGVEVKELQEEEMIVV